MPGWTAVRSYVGSTTGYGREDAADGLASNCLGVKGGAEGEAEEAMVENRAALFAVLRETYGDEQGGGREDDQSSLERPAAAKSRDAHLMRNEQSSSKRTLRGEDVCSTFTPLPRCRDAQSPSLGGGGQQSWRLPYSDRGG